MCLGIFLLKMVVQFLMLLCHVQNFYIATCKPDTNNTMYFVSIYYADNVNNRAK